MTGDWSTVDRDEAGSGSVLTLLTIALALTGFVVVIVTGSYLVADHRAVAAADQAALSGARTYGHTGDRSIACRAADRVAALNDARLTACRVIGDRTDFAVTVEVVAEVGVLWPGLPSEIPATATAGRLHP